VKTSGIILHKHNHRTGEINQQPSIERRQGVSVGDATVRGKPVPIVKIFKEHLTKKMGLVLVDGGEIDDEIKRRRLFKGRKNTSPNGIKIEHLIFLTKQ